MRMPLSPPLLATVLLANVLLAACSETTPGYPPRQPPADYSATVEIAAGQQLFARLCASCHGHPGEGRSPRADFFQPPAPDFTTSAYRSRDPAYLFWRIEVGKNVEPYLSRGSVMPAWRGLSDREIWQLVAYLRSRAGD